MPFMFKSAKNVSLPTVLIVSPLNSIIEEQLNRYGERAVKFSDVFASLVSESGGDSASCDFTYIIGHPEDFLNSNARKLFQTKAWQEKVKFIVIDEVHCVVQWGEEFRTQFKELCQLRAFFPKANVLGLTATLSDKMGQEIDKILCLKNALKITSSIDGPNIKIIVKPRLPSGHSSFVDVVAPLGHQLRTHKTKFPKTVVYTKLNWCGIGYEETVRSSLTHNMSNSEITSLVGQYHSPCTPEMKSKVVSGMGEADGDLRLLYATEAYSMGTDAPDIQNIIHIGVPTTLETYIQEIGRAGRNGQQAAATLYFNQSDVAVNVPGMTSEMRQFCQLQTCRREFICSHFSCQFDQALILMHNCCDICEKKCNCTECINKTLQPVTQNNDNPKFKRKTASIILNALLFYFESENSLLKGNAPLYTGLSTGLAEYIASNYNVFTTKQNLLEKYPAMDILYISNIVAIINQVLSQLQKV
ncbi:ATP-dependent DNA helicase Q1-like [Ptychodera flava]|uniref:ATP-dependent DNA helicase Q1-like n=1 Tax=Ptychodera flava TaxID=63121 RepID=UPI003969E0EF